MSEQSAFPYTEHCREGMTLRDYFAAQALQALIIREGKDALYINEITTTAYQYADDMLQEREA
jgi:hypothetical protein